MSEPQERTQYASSILVSQKPIDATEIVRVRLSQAKLLNDEFSNFFKKYYDIKAQYLNQLNQLVSHSQDLNKNIEHSIVENNVLSSEELKHYNLDAIGHLSEIWNKVIGEIQDEISANNSLKRVVENEVIKPLTDYTAKNRQWAEIRNLHSKLSDVAKNIELSQEKLEKYGDSARHHDKAEKYSAQLQSANATWDSEAPFVFEAFENTDFSRLNFLRDSLLRFITAYTDSLNKISNSNEQTLETILNFNPELEITRFAKVSSETTYIPKEARKAAESPVVKSAPQGPTPSSAAATPSKKNRTSSIATNTTSGTAFTAGNAASLSNGTPDGKKEKKRTKLKSKVGSIFHKKDKKNKKKLNIAGALPEPETSSLNDSVRPPQNRRGSRTSSFMSLGNNLSASNVVGNGAHASPAKDPSPLSQQRDIAPAVPQKTASPSYAPMSVTQAPLKPSSRSSPSASNIFNGQQSVNSYSESSSHINSATQSPVDNSFQPPVSQNFAQYQHQEPLYHQPQQQQYPTTLAPQAVEQDQQRAPPPPPSRKTGTLTNIREDSAYTFEQPAVNHQTSHGELPPQPPVNRRDIQSGLFTNLNATDLENNQNKRISSFNSFAGAVPQLCAQTTGSSLGGVAGGLFQHPEMTQLGLNASVAEVINAKFKDGEQVQGQVIGELAFNYHSDDMNIPTRTNLKIQGSEVFDKIIPNNQFFKQIDTEEFEIVPSAILGRTLGGLKYSIKEFQAPVVILPAWRFEPHQASVMLTLKLSPDVANALRPGEFVVLDDLVVAVSIKGASKSALSKPQGTFSKDKSRITWRFKEPVKLSATSDEKLVARFMTDEQAVESEQGVLIKFSVNNDTGASAVTSKLTLLAQDFSEDDPFGESQWGEVPTFRTLVAGSYTGLA